MLSLLLRLWFLYHLFDPVIIISILNYQIVFIPLILVHLLLLLPLFIVFMSLHPIERLFVIDFGRMLWMRNLLFYIRLIYGVYFHCHQENFLLDLVGYIKSRQNHMAQLKGIKLGLLLKDIPNNMAWVMRKHLLLWQRWLLFVP